MAIGVKNCVDKRSGGAEVGSAPHDLARYECIYDLTEKVEREISGALDQREEDTSLFVDMFSSNDDIQKWETLLADAQWHINEARTLLTQGGHEKALKFANIAWEKSQIAHRLLDGIENNAVGKGMATSFAVGSVATAVGIALIGSEAAAATLGLKVAEDAGIGAILPALGARLGTMTIGEMGKAAVAAVFAGGALRVSVDAEVAAIEAAELETEYGFTPGQQVRSFALGGMSALTTIAVPAAAQAGLPSSFFTPTELVKGYLGSAGRAWAVGTAMVGAETIVSGGDLDSAAEAMAMATAGRMIAGLARGGVSFAGRRLSSSVDGMAGAQWFSAIPDEPVVVMYTDDVIDVDTNGNTGFPLQPALQLPQYPPDGFDYDQGPGPIAIREPGGAVTIPVLDPPLHGNQIAIFVVGGYSYETTREALQKIVDRIGQESVENIVRMIDGCGVEGEEDKRFFERFDTVAWLMREKKVVEGLFSCPLDKLKVLARMSTVAAERITKYPSLRNVPYDLHNLFASIISVALEIENQLAESGSISSEIIAYVADITVHAAVNGPLYYSVNSGDSQCVETTIMLLGAAERYRISGFPDRAMAVEERLEELRPRLGVEGDALEWARVERLAKLRKVYALDIEGRERQEILGIVENWLKDIATYFSFRIGNAAMAEWEIRQLSRILADADLPNDEAIRLAEQFRKRHELIMSVRELE